ncbi:MAG: DUF3160 domain-containing protein [Anaerolineae bacterium]|nr:DUF3160 domain-containing protein [Anaerolineae bacterium]
MTKRTVFLLVLVTIVISACAPAPTPGPTAAPILPPDPTATPAPPPGPTPTPAPPQPIVVRPGGFAVYVPVPVDVAPAAPAYTPDLSAVANPDLLARLDETQQAALEANGFVVVPQGYEQIYAIYQQADEASIPAFVTTDAVLHSFHILYDYALRLAEIEHFIADLESLNAAMLKAAEADYTATTGPVQEAAYQNLAFFAVATKLLTPDAEMPAPVRGVLEEELALIEAHEGITFSPIFGYREDYSQYVPRGHYTRNEDFERYFRAMMWYGRMAFHLVNPDDPEAARRETRGALLIVRALHQGDLLDTWERIYEPTAFFVGTADDLTVYDYTAVAEAVYGGLPDPATLADATQLDEFIATARQLRPPAIVGGFVTDQEEPEDVTMGFRFMGQRFIPDSYMFQQLVYNQVGLYRGSGKPFTMSPSQAGPIRAFPRGLDVPAVLGSGRALEILTAEGDTDYNGYAEQLAKLQAEFAALPEEQWTANLYWNWLHTLRPLLEVKGEGYPYFMQSPAWPDEDLHTWLGSWTELRHDTILYAKQSYAVMATGMMPEPEPARGYVEPQPEVYARLAALTAQMQAGLGGRGLVGDEMAWKLEWMEQLLLALKTISEKELRGEGLTDDEYATIRFIGDALENLTTFSEEVEGQITSAADERMALIADVHTDPNTGQVLEEGVGDGFPIYVVVLVEGRQVVTLGSVFSYYEFKWPMNDRLTDEAWQEMSPLPDRPAWTGSFIVE